MHKLKVPRFLHYLGVIPEVRPRRIAHDAIRKVLPHLVGKVELVRVQDGILVQREHGVRFDVLVGKESLGYAGAFLVGATAYHVQWDVPRRGPPLPGRGRPIAGPQYHYLGRNVWLVVW